jgi:hypothetical protein
VSLKFSVDLVVVDVVYDATEDYHIDQRRRVMNIGRLQRPEEMPRA